MTSGPLLEVSGLHVSFGSGRYEREVVHDLSFTVGAGETFAIVGESGSGKSVTAHAIMGLLPKGSGRITAGTDAFRAAVHDRFARDVAADGPERLYISRTRLENEDSLVDQEGQIEMMMAAAGYTIFHPERYSIRQQVEHLMAARMVVGADGSAFHLAAHVLQPGTRVGLIKRRHRTEVFNAIARQIVAFSGVELSTLHPLLPEEEGQDRARLNLHRLERALKRKGFL